MINAFGMSLGCIPSRSSLSFISLCWCVCVGVCVRGCEVTVNRGSERGRERERVRNWEKSNVMIRKTSIDCVFLCDDWNEETNHT